MSYLPDYYHMCNEEGGHAYNCAWGAGADCTCGKYNREHGHHKDCNWGDPEWPGPCNCGKDGPNTLKPIPELDAVVSLPNVFDEDDIPF